MFSWCTELSYKTGVPSIKEKSTYLNSGLQMLYLMNNYKIINLQRVWGSGEERLNTFVNFLIIYFILDQRILVFSVLLKYTIHEIQKSKCISILYVCCRVSVFFVHFKNQYKCFEYSCMPRLFIGVQYS